MIRESAENLGSLAAGYPVDPETLKPLPAEAVELTDMELAIMYHQGLQHACALGEDIEYRKRYDATAPDYSKDRMTDMTDEWEASRIVRAQRQAELEQ